MDDPTYAWPSWKFGMKREDLFTKLHDQYNTFTFTIQDPDAFHHDVYELSTEACSQDEFHRLMAERRQQRLNELNESLQSAAIEIIANPKLIGSEQWSFAIQLFRTRSFDSLVRYFANYLPDGYLDRHTDTDAASTISSSFTEDNHSVYTESTSASSVGDADGPHFFPDHVEEKPISPTPGHLLRINTSIKMVDSTELPPSPRSMTMQSDSAVSSPTESHHHDFALHRITPARSLSFSGSESEAFGGGRRSGMSEGEAEEGVEEEEEEEETSQQDELDFESHSIDTIHQSIEYSHHTSEYIVADEEEDEEYPPAQLPGDIFDNVIDSIESDPAETPTPRPEPHLTSYLDLKNTPTIRRIPSPFRENTNKNRSYHSGSPKGIRRSPEEATCRISKPLPDTARTTRQKGRRRGLD